MTTGEKLNEWRKRKSLSDLINNNKYLFNSWRSIRYTNKGKSIGNDPMWNSFQNFYNDMHDSYKSGLRLSRLDKNKWFCKENCKWLSDEENNLLKGNYIRLQYNGKTLTFKEWSAEIGVTANSIKQRYYRHPEWCTKDILFGRKRKRGSKIVKDWKDCKTMTIRQKASKMISAYKHRDIHNGLTVCDIDIDWMINNIIKKPCVYCGDTSRVGCDRIDNNFGHTKDNVVPCCYECNCARNNNFTHKEMFIIGEAIKEIKQQCENAIKK